jgi:uncharacterized protein YoxC
MQLDIQKIKLLIGEQAVTISALASEVENVTKERDELKAKLETLTPKPRAVAENG